MEQTSRKPVLGTVPEWFRRSAPEQVQEPTKALRERTWCRAGDGRVILVSDWTADQWYWRPKWGLSLFFELDLALRRHPMPRWRGYRIETQGAPSDALQAIHVSSDHRGMGSVASHLRGSSVHSIVYLYI